MVERGSGEYAKDKTRGRARVEAEPEKDGGKEEGGEEDDRKTGGPKGSEEEVRGLVGKREETEQAAEPGMAGMLELSDQEFKTNMINNVRVLWIKYTELKKNGQCMQRDGNLFFWPHGKRDLP